MQPFRILLGTKVVCDLMPNTPANKKTAHCFAKSMTACVRSATSGFYIR